MRNIGKIAFAGASLLAFATPAYAQNTADEGMSSDDGDIIVTARRRDESAQDVPLVVNAVTAAEINKLNIRKFDDIVKVIPGLTIQQNANGIGSTTTVRGVKYDVNASGNNGTVEYYLNDAPISAGFVLQSLFDVGQVELLRGPQGTLRGRASPSGSITVTTRKPDLNEIGGYVAGTGTEGGAINAQAAVGVPIIPGVLAVRVAGIVDNNNANEVRSIYGGEKPYSRTRAIRASARLDPFDGLSVNFMYQRLQQKIRAYDQVESTSLTNTEAGIQPSNPYAGNTLIRARDRLAAGNIPRNVTQDFETFSGSVDWRFAGQRLVYVVNHSIQKLVSQENGDRGDLYGPAYAGFSGVGANLGQLQNFGQFTDSGSVQQSHEIRLQSDERLFGMVDYVVGGLINKMNSPTTLSTYTPVFCRDNLQAGVPCNAVPFLGDIGQYPSPSAFLQLNRTPVSTESTTNEHSIFGNLTLHLGERTEISGGGRYIMYRNRHVMSVGGRQLRNVDESYSAWIYSASAKHRFSDGFMVYANIGSSWRPPATAIGDFSLCTDGLNYAFAPVLSCNREVGFITTAPERSTSYELGFKSNLFDRRLTLNATVFHQKFSNFVYRSPGVGAPFVNYGCNTLTATALNPCGIPTQNVQTFNFISGVPVKVTGVEVEANWKVSDNFNFGGSFTYAVGKIRNGYIPCADANNDGIPDATEALPLQGSFNTIGHTIQGCVVNQRANDAPVFSGNIQAEYHAPISSKVDGYLRGLFSYYGNSQGDPLNRYDDVKGYGMLDLFLGIRDPNGAWEVQAFAKNLTNTYRTLSRTAPITSTVGLTNGTSLSEFTNYRGVSSTAPREFGLNVRYAFGSR